MSEIKFVKACCEKTGRYLGLQVKKIGSAWRVVNVIPLSEAQGRLLPSEVEQPSFETHTTLLACPTCGNRRVGGCGCPPRVRECRRGDEKYRFDCTYCKHMKVDYSLPTPDEVGAQGGTMKLSQGQEVEIRYADNRPLRSIYVGVGWDPVVSGGNSMDVDSSVVVMGSGAYDLVYFAHKEHESGCVIHHGDNLTGAGGAQDVDDENITVTLDRVPANRDKLVFVLNIYNCYSRHQTLDSVKNLYIRLYDPDSKKVLIEYRVNGNTGNDTAMVIGVASRSGSGWKFKAIGRSLRVETVSELASECHRFL